MDLRQPIKTCDSKAARSAFLAFKSANMFEFGDFGERWDEIRAAPQPVPTRRGGKPSRAADLRTVALKSEHIACLVDPRQCKAICSSRCPQQQHCAEFFNFGNILQLRHAFWGSSGQVTSREHRRDFLYRMLCGGITKTNVNDSSAGAQQYTLSYIVNGKSLCEKFFLALLAIPDGRQYQRVKKAVQMPTNRSWPSSRNLRRSSRGNA